MNFRGAVLRILFKREVEHIESRLEYLKKMRNSESDRFTEDYYMARLDETLIIARALEIVG